MLLNIKVVFCLYSKAYVIIVIEFAKRIKKIQEEARVTLKKVQKKIKRQADKERKEAEV